MADNPVIAAHIRHAEHSIHTDAGSGPIYCCLNYTNELPNALQRKSLAQRSSCPFLGRAFDLQELPSGQAVLNSTEACLVGLAMTNIASNDGTAAWFTAQTPPVALENTYIVGQTYGGFQALQQNRLISIKAE